VPRESLTIPARDGFALAADLHQPEGAPAGAVLLAPAMGVTRRHYAPFAAFLARHGFAVLAVDVRGIGGSRPPSLRGFPASLHGWGEDDLSGAIDFLAARFPGVPRLWIGHSAGGQLFGLHAGPDVAGAVLVAAQHGHWRNWRGSARLAMAALWWAVIPAAVRLVGWLPMRALRQGEDVPAGVAREWARWGRHRSYIGLYAQRRPDAAFVRFAGPVRLYAIEDDPYAPVASVEALAACFAAARVEVRRVRPAALGVRAVGHFGFFRPRFETTLWAEVLGWLRSAAEAAGTPAGVPEEAQAQAPRRTGAPAV
jgi:predicted alpha/beta hydrolase